VVELTGCHSYIIDWLFPAQENVAVVHSSFLSHVASALQEAEIKLHKLFRTPQVTVRYYYYYYY
jgi:hypothetical protein